MAGDQCAPFHGKHRIRCDSMPPAQIRGAGIDRVCKAADLRVDDHDSGLWSCGRSDGRGPQRQGRHGLEPQHVSRETAHGPPGLDLLASMRSAQSGALATISPSRSTGNTVRVESDVRVKSDVITTARSESCERQRSREVLTIYADEIALRPRRGWSIVLPGRMWSEDAVIGDGAPPSPSLSNGADRGLLSPLVDPPHLPARVSFTGNTVRLR